MKHQNIAIQVSAYATEELNRQLNKYGDLGFRIVNAVLALNKHHVEVMYLFFTKDLDQTEGKTDLSSITNGFGGGIK